MPIPRSMSGFLTLLLAAGPCLSGVGWAAEPAAIAEGAVDRMIGLNRRAYLEIQEQHFQAAKYHLSEALVISETAGLESDAMTARTYVHLAVVHLSGFKDRDEALRYFKLALTIDPTVTITAGLESAALKLAYLEAREQLGLPPNPDAITPLSRQPEGALERDELAPAMAPSTHARRGPMESTDEPDPPARVPLPVFCALPFEVPAARDLLVRCVTQRQQQKAGGTLYYRPYGSEGEYTKVPLQRSAKGWLVAVVPGQAVQGKSLRYFVEARIPVAPEALFFGHADNPNEVPIRLPSNADSADEDVDDTLDEEQTPIAPAHRPSNAPVRLGRLRSPGTLWLALAGGCGSAYHGRVAVDSNSAAPNGSTPAYVGAGFSPMWLFHVEPEIGYQWTRRFAISVMGRYQYAPEDAEGYTPGEGERGIDTSAFAAFVRGHITLLARGRFEAAASLGAGGGTSFLAVVRKHCDEADCRLDHSDTVHGGGFGVLAGMSAVYRVARNVGVLLDVKEIATLPKPMAATEVSLGLVFAQPVRGDDQAQARADNERVRR